MRSTQESGQILRSKKRPRRTLRSGRGSRTNSNTSRQIPARVIDAAYDTLPAAGFCAETRAQPLIAPLAADLYLRKRSVFGCPPRPLTKFGLGIDRRPTHNSPMNKLYYERADYSVVVKNRAPRFTGPEMSTPSSSHRSISTLPRRPINLLTFSNFGRIGLGLGNPFQSAITQRSNIVVTHSSRN